MWRTTRSLIGAMVVLCGSSVLAQQPPKGSGEDYFPLIKGAKWTYKVGDNEVIVTVVKSETINKEEHFQVDTIVGKEPKTSEWYVVRSDGIYRTKVKDDKIEPPIKVVPLPIKKDETWKVESKLGTQSIKGTLKIVNDKEKIKVQGTEYETVLIEGKDVDVAGAKTTLRIWLAKDRGIVKEEFLLQGGETLLLELKSYTAK
ncbi:MAG: hypothetical protein RMJ56_02830 [Gemmataceae bacterium]|nr:hypothetical protein [Gemmata sp.]MDW8196522.1 hypothetical protein [Gemmataceae bacterium]